jgi:hypothetical protein
MPLRALIAAPVLAVAVCGQALAADVVGFGEAFDTLYSVNLTTRMATEIGRATPVQAATRLANIEGLTLSPSGQLFAVSDAGAKTLLTIDKHTGLASVVGTLNLGTTAQLDIGLAFTTDGNLWLTSGTGNLWQVNPGDASVTLIGNLGIKVTGLTSRGNTLFGAGSQGNNRLYQIDPSTAHAQLLGEYGAAINFVTTASPAFDANGKLWVVLDYVPPPSGPQAQWSDLATGSLDGTLSNQGAITAAAGRSADDLAYIGLKGLAIVAPQGQGVAPTPAASWPMLALLGALLALVAGTRLRRNRPIR